MQRQSSEKVIEPLIPILETKVIPWWERDSLERLAVSASTPAEFQHQQIPPLMRVSVKKRISRKSTFRGTRNYNNMGSYRAFWREDDQAIYNFPALVFVLAGQADFHIADYVVHCPQDHFLLFADNVPRPKGSHSHFVDENASGRKCDVLWFFAPPGTSSVVSYVCHSQEKKHWGDGYRIVHRAEVVNSFQLFLQEMQGKPAGYQQIARSSFHTFLHLFLRELKEGKFLGGRNSAAHISPQKLNSSPIEEAKQYVRTHLNQRLTSEVVAREMYMSRNSFIQHFSRETGQTFHDFVIDERMEEAHRLLSEGNWSIGFVCRFIGLKPTRFRVQFKERFGVTPSELRKQLSTIGQKR
jgi:AraC-like DNA-binding protein